MEEIIKLRPATIKDAEILLKWRNDPQTRKNTHNTQQIDTEEHIIWLTRTLANNNRKLFVAESNEVPVGTVRADYSEGCYELSWTVAPDARGRGIGKEMVAILAHQIAEPIRAEVKVGNEASKRIAEYAGMKFDHEENGILHYRRSAIHR